MTNIYSVYESQSIEDIGFKCITEAFDYQEAINNAQEYYCQIDEENGEFGRNDRNVVIVKYNDETGEETCDLVNISWVSEKDTYDGGRYDYYTSRI